MEGRRDRPWAPQKVISEKIKEEERKRKVIRKLYNASQQHLRNIYRVFHAKLENLYDAFLSKGWRETFILAFLSAL